MTKVSGVAWLKERHKAAETVHTWRQGCARARWTVDLRTSPRSRLTNPTSFNRKGKNKKKVAESHFVIPQTASKAALTTLMSRGLLPRLSHCPGAGCPGSPHWGRRGPKRSRSRAVAQAGSLVRSPRGQKSPEATRASSGQHCVPPCPWPCHSSGRPSAGWRLASAWRHCTLPPPHGQSSLLGTEKNDFINWRKYQFTF